MKKTELEIRNIINSKLSKAIESLDEISLQIPHLLPDVQNDAQILKQIMDQLSQIKKKNYSEEAIAALPKFYSVPVIVRFIESEEKKRTGSSLLIGLKDNLILATNERPGRDISEDFLFQNVHRYRYVSDNKIAQLKKRLDIFIKNLT